MQKDFVSMKFKRLNILVIVVLFSGCSSQQLTRFAAEAISDSQVAYSKRECSAMKLRCPGQSYDEWKTSNGKFGCSCSSR